LAKAPLFRRSRWLLSQGAPRWAAVRPCINGLGSSVFRAARVRQRPPSQATKSAARNAHSQADLQQQLNEIRGYVAQIAIDAHRMGLQPDLLLSLAQRETKTSGAMDCDRLVVQYISNIGLLAKLDTNVLGLAR
jgi:hypothetical protein